MNPDLGLSQGTNEGNGPQGSGPHKAHAWSWEVPCLWSTAGGSRGWRVAPWSRQLGWWAQEGRLRWEGPPSPAAADLEPAPNQGSVEGLRQARPIFEKGHGC